ncbi:LLM class flavin-dependent oxidoreductase [Fodinicola acaciae]|uniref:LLM class flavin-dependent oxidoreductase n=1 Tax=Fodinicola acaciae TaxID=2681555 RepID=UPI0013D49D58|nr:LLM class flavin-dependent oxidoreductase [Fodinicola acaciae]
MTSIGAVCRPQVPPEQLRDVVRAADDAGLEQLWLWEDCFFQGGFSSAAAALAWTERLRVGVGVMPVPLRNVGLMAMETAAMHRMFGGRFIPAIGHGNQPWMAQVSARVESPLTLLREYANAMRALLRGERVTTDGRYVKLDDVTLDWPPSSAPAVLAAAVGPKTLKLVGEVADGTVLDASARPDTVRRARELIDAGRAAAGRTDHHEIVVYLHAATGPDASERIAAELKMWKERPIEEYADGVTAESVAQAARNLVDAGADTVVLEHTSEDPDLPAFVRFAATEVRQLVK